MCMRYSETLTSKIRQVMEKSNGKMICSKRLSLAVNSLHGENKYLSPNMHGKPWKQGWYCSDRKSLEINEADQDFPTTPIYGHSDTWNISRGIHVFLPTDDKNAIVACGYDIILPVVCYLQDFVGAGGSLIAQAVFQKVYVRPQDWAESIKKPHLEEESAQW